MRYSNRNKRNEIEGRFVFQIVTDWIGRTVASCRAVEKSSYLSILSRVLLPVVLKARIRIVIPGYK